VHKEVRSAGFLVWPQNHGQWFLPVWPEISGFGFSSLSLKTDSYSLVIWASKSPQRFLSLGLKTKCTMVYRLWHKTYRRMKMVRDTRRDLVACFTRKQVKLGFPSLASKLVEAWRRWCMWHHRRGHVELKLKMAEASWRKLACFQKTRTG
jgi:hypothetical protein